MFNLKYLLSYRVEVEPYRSLEMLQCSTCQRLGHSQKTCFSDRTCVKCGVAHLICECKKPRNTSGHCSNCIGDHPANYRDFKVLKSALDQRRINKKKEDASPTKQTSPTNTKVVEPLPMVPSYRHQHILVPSLHPRPLPHSQ